MTKNKIIPYQPYLKELARELRKNSTLAEILLWQEIKGRKLGYQFHRQVPIDNFIVDFYCHELMLAIEVDGASHDNEISFKLDKNRQKRLEALGVRFLRLDDVDVKHQIEAVLIDIENCIEEITLG